MKVLVIGSQGSMGKRYCAILKYLGVEYEGVDKDDNIRYGSFTHAIIATPTYNHPDQIYVISEMTHNILCEKPIHEHLDRIKFCIDVAKRDKSTVNMVCNWKYALGNKPIGTYDIEYSNYNTGKGGVEWDCIQLIYLARSLKIDTDLPYFECVVHSPLFQSITLAEIERSYITMIKHWLEMDGRENDLWTLDDALKATEKVIEWNKKQ